MELSTLLDLATFVALVAGIAFGAVEWRRARADARRQRQLLLLRSFESPEFVRAMRTILDLPDGLTRDEIETRLGADGADLVWYWLGITESLGLLTFEREIDIRDIDRTFGGPVILTFRRLRTYVLQVRADTGRDSMHEWFQWLAEHVEQLEHDEGRTPAHIREREWRP